MFVHRPSQLTAKALAICIQWVYSQGPQKEETMNAKPSFFVPFVPLWFRKNPLPLPPAPLRAILLCVLIAATFAHADNWSRFRGPNGAGQSDDDQIPTT